MSNSKIGAKDSAMVSYQRHELISMGKKCGVPWQVVCAVKFELQTNDPNYIQEYIASMKGNKMNLVITNEMMFGGEEDETSA